MTKFDKYQGLGNDFVLFDTANEPAVKDLSAKQISQLCDRRSGVGADGILLYTVLETGKRLRMIYFNSDGSRAETCFNGLRCMALHGVRSDDIAAATEFEILQDSGIVKAEVDAGLNTIRIELPAAKYDPLNAHFAGNHEVIDDHLDFSFGELRGTLLSLGNPHFVTWKSNLSLSELEKQVCQTGPLLEKSSHFKQGINFEIASIVNENEINMSVWERGSGFTMACGSGATAAVCAGVKVGSLSKNKPVTVNMSGGHLIVTVNDEDDKIVIEGEAKFVFGGTVDLNNLSTVGAIDDWI